MTGCDLVWRFICKVKLSINELRHESKRERFRSNSSVGSLSIAKCVDVRDDMEGD